MGWSFLSGMGMNLFLASEVQEAQGFANPENFTLVVSTAVVVITILALALWARKGTGLIPSGLGAIFEHVYDFVDDMAFSMIGKRGRRYVPFAMSIFLFVLICNWSSLLPIPTFSCADPADAVVVPEHVHTMETPVPSDVAAPQGEVAAQDSEATHILVMTSGPSAHQKVLDEHVSKPLPPFEAPSVSFNTTLALALVSFLSFNFYGLRQHICGDPAAKKVAVDDGMPHEKGQGLFVGFFSWLGHFLSPAPSLWHELSGALRYLLVPLLGCLFLVLNIIEEVARLVSLSMRLYGNLYGEHQVKSKLIDTCRDFLNNAQQSLNGEVGAALGYALMAGLLWASSFFVTCIGTLAGFIQAFIFFVLTLSYISHVVGEEE